MATAPRDPLPPLQKEPVAAHPPRTVILEGLEGAPYTLPEREFLSRGSKLPPRMLSESSPCNALGTFGLLPFQEGAAWGGTLST